MKHSDYVYRQSWKWNVFLSMVSKRLTGDENWKEGPDGLYYFGAGYWRGKLVYEGDDNKFNIASGIRLINPDKSPEEIAIVTAALNILLGGTK